MFKFTHISACAHFPVLLPALRCAPLDFSLLCVPSPVSLPRYCLVPALPSFLPFSFFSQVLHRVSIYYTTTAKANHPTVTFGKHRVTAPVSYTLYDLPPPIPMVLTMVLACPQFRFMGRFDGLGEEGRSYLGEGRKKEKSLVQSEHPHAPFRNGWFDKSAPSPYGRRVLMSCQSEPV